MGQHDSKISKLAVKNVQNLAKTTTVEHVAVNMRSRNVQIHITFNIRSIVQSSPTFIQEYLS